LQYDVIGIDEVHTFDLDNVAIIANLLKQGKEIIISGLDMDYRGRLFPIVAALLELAPERVKHKRAVCESCKKVRGSYTQVYKDEIPVLDGLPSVLSEHHRYRYAPVCRNCFVQSSD